MWKWLLHSLNFALNNILLPWSLLVYMLQFTYLWTDGISMVLQFPVPTIPSYLLLSQNMNFLVGSFTRWTYDMKDSITFPYFLSNFSPVKKLTFSLLMVKSSSRSMYFIGDEVSCSEVTDLLYNLSSRWWIVYT